MCPLAAGRMSRTARELSSSYTFLEGILPVMMLQKMQFCFWNSRSSSGDIFFSFSSSCLRCSSVICCMERKRDRKFINVMGEKGCRDICNRKGEEKGYSFSALGGRSWPQFPFFKSVNYFFYLLRVHIREAGLRLGCFILLGALQHGSHELLRGVLISLRGFFAEHAGEKGGRLFKVCCGAKMGSILN